MSTVTLRPDGTSSSSGWSPVGGATLHAVLSDGNVGTWADATGGFNSLTVTLGTSALGAGAVIASVQLFLSAQLETGSGPENLSFQLDDPWGTNAPIPSAGVTNAYNTFSSAVYTTRSNGAAWTQSDIDGLTVGLLCTSSAIVVTEVWAVVTYNAAPTIGAVTGMPADGAVRVARTNLTAQADYTDTDGDTGSLNVQVATDAAFASIVLNPFGSATASGATASVAVNVAALGLGTKYYWRARASASAGPNSAWTATKSFTMDVAPSVPALTTVVGTQLPGTKTLAWTFSDPDGGDTQSAYAVRRKLGAGSYEYWDGAAWAGAETKIAGAAGSINGTSFTGSTSVWSWSVKVWDAEDEPSGYATDSTFLVHDAPTSSVTAPTAAGTVSTGGPTLNVTWSYAQAQGIAQATYRVEVLNAALSTTYYDSGVLAGTNTSRAIDAVATGIPTDTSGSALKVRVTVVSSDGAAFTVTTATIAFDIQWGVVTTTITAPLNGAIVNTTSMTVTWTFGSTRAKTQGKFRVRLMNDDESIVFYDSGWVAGAGTSHPIPFLLSDNSQYDLGLQLMNSEGVKS